MSCKLAGELRLLRGQRGKRAPTGPEGHLSHPQERGDSRSQHKTHYCKDDAQNPIRPCGSIERFKHGQTLITTPPQVYSLLHYSGFAGGFGRSKNFHLSMPAGTATSKKPTIISSEV